MKVVEVMAKPKFIELHNQSNGSEMFVNVEQLAAFWDIGTPKGSRIYWGAFSFEVSEEPAEIMRKIKGDDDDDDD